MLKVCPSFLQHWLTELEIFATIFAAAIHDYEHTGTTNNFHVQTRCYCRLYRIMWVQQYFHLNLLDFPPISRSDISLLYNDHAVLENHHVSAVYRLLQSNDETNILSNLSKDDWRWEERICFFSLHVYIFMTPLFIPIFICNLIDMTVDLHFSRNFLLKQLTGRVNEATAKGELRRGREEGCKQERWRQEGRRERRRQMSPVSCSQKSCVFKSF